MKGDRGCFLLTCQVSGAWTSRCRCAEPHEDWRWQENLHSPVRCFQSEWRWGCCTRMRQRLLLESKWTRNTQFTPHTNQRRLLIATCVLWETAHGTGGPTTSCDTETPVHRPRSFPDLKSGIKSEAQLGTTSPGDTGSKMGVQMGGGEGDPPPCR